ncbi:MAG: NRDE family protein [Thiogranum sp.]|nr:NRDE family protein [Thiogranum sp.]
MCTLSWKPIDDGYVLMFNRDEQRSRTPALPPDFGQVGSVMFLAPTDPQHGGTWLLVNEFGVSVALLNHYPEPIPSYHVNAPSRGLLTVACADCHSVDTLVSRVPGIVPTPYAPFRLVAVDLTGAVEIIWDGRTLTSSRLPLQGGMLTSSSVRSQEIEAARRGTFEQLVGAIEAATVAQLAQFHHHTAADGAKGIRMSRSDACTHSIATITVSAKTGAAAMDYQALLPADPQACVTVMRLPLQAGSALP